MLTRLRKWVQTITNTPLGQPAACSADFADVPTAPAPLVNLGSGTTSIGMPPRVSDEPVCASYVFGVALSVEKKTLVFDPALVDTSKHGTAGVYYVATARATGVDPDYPASLPPLQAFNALFQISGVHVPEPGVSGRYGAECLPPAEITVFEEMIRPPGRSPVIRVGLRIKPASPDGKPRRAVTIYNEQWAHAATPARALT